METIQIINEVTDQIASGAEKYIVVRQFSTFFELEVLRKVKKPILGKFCGTLQELALELFERKLIKKRILSDQEILTITAKAIEEAKGKTPDTVYTKIVLKRIRDLIQHEVRPEEIEEAASKLEEVTRKKLLETANILKRYTAFMELSGGYDISLLFSRASKINGTGEKEIVLAFPVFLFPVELTFLNKFNVTSYQFQLPENTFFSKLQESNEELYPLSLKVKKLSPNPLTNVLSLKEERVKTFTKIFIKEFFSFSENVKYIVDTLIDLLDRGFYPHDIAVVSSDVNRLLPMLYPLLKEKGIPFRFQTKGIPLLANPLINQALNRIGSQSKSLTTIEWLEWIILNAKSETSNKEEIIGQLEKLRTELIGLKQKGLLPEKKLSGLKAQKELRELFTDRFYLVEENEPYGVHICSPEAAISLFPKAVIFDSLTEGEYPRAFPFDPDFSYAERKKINEALNRCSPSLEAFPTRERLISYDFLTFSNLLSIPLEELHITFNASRGKSLFTKLLAEKTKIETNKEEIVSKIAADCYKVFKGEKKATTREEKGIESWKLKETDPKFNFFISKKLAKELCKKLTITDIVNYLECPTKALLSLAFPESPDLSLEQVEGIVYHKIIQNYMNTGFDESEFEAIFSKVAQKAQDPVVELLKPYIKSNIKRFLSFFRKHPLFSPLAEKEKKVKFQISDITIEGRIDYVIEKEEEIHIVDFKTGNVTGNSKYKLLNPMSAQLVLYAIGHLYEGDFYSPLKTHLEILNLHFISVSKARKGVEEEKWKILFSGKENSSEIKTTAFLAATAAIAMKNGFFIPHRIVLENSRKKPPEERDIFLKSDSCFEGYQLTTELLRRFEKSVRKIYDHVKKQWNS